MLYRNISWVWWTCFLVQATSMCPSVALAAILPAFSVFVSRDTHFLEVGKLMFVQIIISVKSSNNYTSWLLAYWSTLSLHYLLPIDFFWDQIVKLSSLSFTVMCLYISIRRTAQRRCTVGLRLFQELLWPSGVLGGLLLQYVIWNTVQHIPTTVRIHFA